MITLCKKNFHSFQISLYYNNHKILFEKNTYYEFSHETTNRIWVIYDKNGKPGLVGIRFHIEKNEEKVNAMHNFYDYFYSQRKLKLMKLKIRLMRNFELLKIFRTFEK